MTETIISSGAKRYRGFNLVEAAIVLGVVGLVIGGIWVAAAAVSNNNKLNNFNTKLGRIATDIQTHFATVPLDIAGNTVMTYLVANGYFQASDLISSNVARLPELGPDARIKFGWWPPGYTGYGYDGLEIAITSLDRHNCQILANRLIPFLATFTQFSTTYTPQDMANVILPDCVNVGSLNVRLNGMLPNR